MKCARELSKQQENIILNANDISNDIAVGIDINEIDRKCLSLRKDMMLYGGFTDEYIDTLYKRLIERDSYIRIIVPTKERFRNIIKSIFNYNVLSIIGKAIESNKSDIPLYDRFLFPSIGDVLLSIITFTECDNYQLKKVRELLSLLSDGNIVYSNSKSVFSIKQYDRNSLLKVIGDYILHTERKMGSLSSRERELVSLYKEHVLSYNQYLLPYRHSVFSKSIDSDYGRVEYSNNVISSIIEGNRKIVKDGIGGYTYVKPDDIFYTNKPVDVVISYDDSSIDINTKNNIDALLYADLSIENGIHSFKTIKDVNDTLFMLPSDDEYYGIPIHIIDEGALENMDDVLKEAYNRYRASRKRINAFVYKGNIYIVKDKVYGNVKNSLVLTEELLHVITLFYFTTRGDSFVDKFIKAVAAYHPDIYRKLDLSNIHNMDDIEKHEVLATLIKMLIVNKDNKKDSGFIGIIEDAIYDIIKGIIRYILYVFGFNGNSAVFDRWDEQDIEIRELVDFIIDIIKKESDVGVINSRLMEYISKNRMCDFIYKVEHPILFNIDGGKESIYKKIEEFIDDASSIPNFKIYDATIPTSGIFQKMEKEIEAITSNKTINFPIINREYDSKAFMTVLLEFVLSSNKLYYMTYLNDFIEKLEPALESYHLLSIIKGYIDGKPEYSIDYVKKTLATSPHISAFIQEVRSKNPEYEDSIWNFILNIDTLSFILIAKEKGKPLSYVLLRQSIHKVEHIYRLKRILFNMTSIGDENNSVFSISMLFNEITNIITSINRISNSINISDDEKSDINTIIKGLTDLRETLMSISRSSEVAKITQTMLVFMSRAVEDYFLSEVIPQHNTKMASSFVEETSVSERMDYYLQSNIRNIPRDFTSAIMSEKGSSPTYRDMYEPLFNNLFSNKMDKDSIQKFVVQFIDEEINHSKILSGDNENIYPFYDESANGRNLYIAAISRYYDIEKQIRKGIEVNIAQKLYYDIVYRLLLLNEYKKEDDIRYSNKEIVNTLLTIYTLLLPYFGMDISRFTSFKSFLKYIKNKEPLGSSNDILLDMFINFQKSGRHYDNFTNNKVLYSLLYSVLYNYVYKIMTNPDIFKHTSLFKEIVNFYVEDNSNTEDTKKYYIVSIDKTVNVYFRNDLNNLIKLYFSFLKNGDFRLFVEYNPSDIYEDISRISDEPIKAGDVDSWISNINMFMLMMLGYAYRVKDERDNSVELPYSKTPKGNIYNFFYLLAEDISTIVNTYDRAYRDRNASHHIRPLSFNPDRLIVGGKNIYTLESIKVANTLLGLIVDNRISNRDGIFSINATTGKGDISAFNNSMVIRYPSTLFIDRYINGVINDEFTIFNLFIKLKDISPYMSHILDARVAAEIRSHEYINSMDIIEQNVPNADKKVLFGNNIRTNLSLNPSFIRGIIRDDTLHISTKIKVLEEIDRYLSSINYSIFNRIDGAYEVIRKIYDILIRNGISKVSILNDDNKEVRSMSLSTTLIEKNLTLYYEQLFSLVFIHSNNLPTDSIFSDNGLIKESIANYTFLSTRRSYMSALEFELGNSAAEIKDYFLSKTIESIGGDNKGIKYITNSSIEKSIVSDSENLYDIYSEQIEWLYVVLKDIFDKSIIDDFNRSLLRFSTQQDKNKYFITFSVFSYLHTIAIFGIRYKYDLNNENRTESDIFISYVNNLIKDIASYINSNKNANIEKINKLFYVGMLSFIQKAYTDKTDNALELKNLPILSSAISNIKDINSNIAISSIINRIESLYVDNDEKEYIELKDRMLTIMQTIDRKMFDNILNNDTLLSYMDKYLNKLLYDVLRSKASISISDGSNFDKDILLSNKTNVMEHDTLFAINRNIIKGLTSLFRTSYVYSSEDNEYIKDLNERSIGNVLLGFDIFKLSSSLFDDIVVSVRYEDTKEGEKKQSFVNLRDYIYDSLQLLLSIMQGIENEPKDVIEFVYSNYDEYKDIISSIINIVGDKDIHYVDFVRKVRMLALKFRNILEYKAKVDYEQVKTYMFKDNKKRKKILKDIENSLNEATNKDMAFSKYNPNERQAYTYNYIYGVLRKSYSIIRKLDVVVRTYLPSHIDAVVEDEGKDIDVDIYVKGSDKEVSIPIKKTIKVPLYRLPGLYIEFGTGYYNANANGKMFLTKLYASSGGDDSRHKLSYIDSLLSLGLDELLFNVARDDNSTEYNRDIILTSWDIKYRVLKSGRYGRLIEIIGWDRLSNIIDYLVSHLGDYIDDYRNVDVVVRNAIESSGAGNRNSGVVFLFVRSIVGIILRSYKHDGSPAPLLLEEAIRRIVGDDTYKAMVDKYGVFNVIDMFKEVIRRIDAMNLFEKMSVYLYYAFANNKGGDITREAMTNFVNETIIVDIYNTIYEDLLSKNKDVLELYRGQIIKDIMDAIFDDGEKKNIIEYCIKLYNHIKKGDIAAYYSFQDDGVIVVPMINSRVIKEANSFSVMFSESINEGIKSGNISGISYFGFPITNIVGNIKERYFRDQAYSSIFRNQIIKPENSATRVNGISSDDIFVFNKNFNIPLEDIISLNSKQQSIISSLKGMDDKSLLYHYVYVKGMMQGINIININSVLMSCIREYVDANIADIDIDLGSISFKVGSNPFTSSVIFGGITDVIAHNVTMADKHLIYTAYRLLTLLKKADFKVGSIDDNWDTYVAIINKHLLLLDKLIGGNTKISDGKKTNIKRNIMRLLFGVDTDRMLIPYDIANKHIAASYIINMYKNAIIMMLLYRNGFYEYDNFFVRNSIQSGADERKSLYDLRFVEYVQSVFSTINDTISIVNVSNEYRERKRYEYFRRINSAFNISMSDLMTSDEQEASFEVFVNYYGKNITLKEAVLNHWEGVLGDALFTLNIKNPARRHLYMLLEYKMDTNRQRSNGAHNNIWSIAINREGGSTNKGYNIRKHEDDTRSVVEKALDRLSLNGITSTYSSNDINSIPYNTKLAFRDTISRTVYLDDISKVFTNTIYLYYKQYLNNKNSTTSNKFFEIAMKVLLGQNTNLYVDDKNRRNREFSNTIFRYLSFIIIVMLYYHSEMAIANVIATVLWGWFIAFDAYNRKMLTNLFRARVRGISEADIIEASADFISWLATNISYVAVFISNMLLYFVNAAIHSISSVYEDITGRKVLWLRNNPMVLDTFRMLNMKNTYNIIDLISDISNKNYKPMYEDSEIHLYNAGFSLRRLFDIMYRTTVKPMVVSVMNMKTSMEFALTRSVIFYLVSSRYIIGRHKISDYFITDSVGDVVFNKEIIENEYSRITDKQMKGKTLFSYEDAFLQVFIPSYFEKGRFTLSNDTTQVVIMRIMEVIEGLGSNILLLSLTPREATVGSYEENPLFKFMVSLRLFLISAFYYLVKNTSTIISNGIPDVWNYLKSKKYNRSFTFLSRMLVKFSIFLSGYVVMRIALAGIGNALYKSISFTISGILSYDFRNSIKEILKNICDLLRYDRAINEGKQDIGYSADDKRTAIVEHISTIENIVHDTVNKISDRLYRIANIKKAENRPYDMDFLFRIAVSETFRELNEKIMYLGNATDEQVIDAYNTAIRGLKEISTYIALYELFTEYLSNSDKIISNIEEGLEQKRLLGVFSGIANFDSSKNARLIYKAAMIKMSNSLIDYFNDIWGPKVESKREDIINSTKNAHALFIYAIDESMLVRKSNNRNPISFISEPYSFENNITLINLEALNQANVINFNFIDDYINNIYPNPYLYATRYDNTSPIAVSTNLTGVIVNKVIRATSEFSNIYDKERRNVNKNTILEDPIPSYVSDIVNYYNEYISEQKTDLGAEYIDLGPMEKTVVSALKVFTYVGGVTFAYNTPMNYALKPHIFDNYFNDMLVKSNDLCAEANE